MGYGSSLASAGLRFRAVTSRSWHQLAIYVQGFSLPGRVLPILGLAPQFAFSPIKWGGTCGGVVSGIIGFAVRA